MSTDAGSRRFGLRNAFSFLWHIRMGRRHANDIYFEQDTDLVRCKCGKAWR